MRVSPLLPVVLLVVLLTGCAAPAAVRHGAPQDTAAPADAAAPRTASAPPSAIIAPAEAALPRWGVDRIDPELRRRLVGRNWHPGCPVPIGDLRLVTVRYVGFDGQEHAGPLVLNERVADDVLWVFRRLFRNGFPIHRVALAGKWRPTRPKDWFDTSNVSGSFNCRPATDSTSLSEHSFGWAVDIDPLQNPYVAGDGSVLRRAVKPYLDRTRDRPGMIHPGDLVVRSFARIGWSWGGDWDSLKDYMHFSLTGR
jgi:hypothetical protein